MEQKDLLRVEFMQIVDPFGRVNVRLETPRLRLECPKLAGKVPFSSDALDHLRFNIFIKGNDDLRIGYVYLFNDLRQTELYYGLDFSQGRRKNFYASEATFAVIHGLLPQLKVYFHEQHPAFSNLFARVDFDNEDSQKICERVLRGDQLPVPEHVRGLSLQFRRLPGVGG